MINQANCDVEDLYGASAADVTNVSLAIADLIYPIGDHDGSEYPIANEEVADELADESAEEQLAGFIAAVAGDALRLEHATDPTLNAPDPGAEGQILSFLEPPPPPQSAKTGPPSPKRRDPR